jgi:hypothetical protein
MSSPAPAPTPALQIHAGPKALAHLRERGLKPSDVHIVPGAAGGPKGLVLNAIDKLLMVDWLPQATHPVHVMGSSIGAWRLALACLQQDPRAAFEQWAHDYVHQAYPHAPGKQPTPQTIQTIFADTLKRHFGGREAEVLSHPTFRLHVFTSRGRGLLHRDGRRGYRFTTALGYAGAMATNAASRRAMGTWLERVLFSDARDPLPMPLNDFRTKRATLAVDNLRASLLASCSIPFWLPSVRDIPGGPRGAYWDGGITDYHLHLPYSAMHDGLVLYPHFQASVVPGWLDKGLKHRHRATAMLDNVVVLSPSKAFVATLPNGKLPDRQDFKTYGDDDAARIKAWARVLAECERLGDELAQALQAPSLTALPLV